MGDAEPDVQKALAWAYRSLTVVDRPATEAALRAETERAAATGRRPSRLGHPRHPGQARSGHGRRAPARLAGIRKRPGAPATSAAAEAAARFGRLPDPAHHPEPPL